MEITAHENLRRRVRMLNRRESGFLPEDGSNPLNPRRSVARSNSLFPSGPVRSTRSSIVFPSSEIQGHRKSFSVPRSPSLGGGVLSRVLPGLPVSPPRPPVRPVLNAERGIDSPDQPRISKMGAAREGGSKIPLGSPFRQTGQSQSPPHQRKAVLAPMRNALEFSLEKLIISSSSSPTFPLGSSASTFPSLPPLESPISPKIYSSPTRFPHEKYSV